AVDQPQPQKARQQKEGDRDPGGGDAGADDDRRGEDQRAGDDSHDDAVAGAVEFVDEPVESAMLKVDLQVVLGQFAEDLAGLQRQVVHGLHQVFGVGGGTGDDPPG